MMQALSVEAARFHGVMNEARREVTPSYQPARTTWIPVRNNGDNQQDGMESPAPEPVRMETLAVQFEGGPPLARPCVDCGLNTGRFCDGDEESDELAYK